MKEILNTGNLLKLWIQVTDVTTMYLRLYRAGNKNDKITVIHGVELQDLFNFSHDCKARDLNVTLVEPNEIGSKYLLIYKFSINEYVILASKHEYKYFLINTTKINYN